jgi:hypothetical protein
MKFLRNDTPRKRIRFCGYRFPPQTVLLEFFGAGHADAPWKSPLDLTESFEVIRFLEAANKRRETGKSVLL